MKLKKLALALSTVVLLAACSSKDNSTTTSSSTAKSEASNQTSSTSEETTLVDDGVLDLGTCADFPPYESYEGEEIVGIDPDIANAIGDKLGLKVKLHDMDFSNIIAGVEGGKLDGAISGISITEDRAKQVNFSEAYAKSVQVVLVKEDSDVKSINDLKGKKIATQLGSTGDTLANSDFDAENVQAFAKFSDAVLALQNGKVDAIILDKETADKFEDANDDLDILDSAYADEEYSIAISKDNQELLDKVNEVINELKENGELEKIVNKYE